MEKKTILVGVTGCIAAYKSCQLVRDFQKAGYRVKVVMTEHAQEFVGATTFRGLTNEEVAVDLFCNPTDPIHHISLAKECDVFVIAPATANVVAKIARGVADDLLTTTAVATGAPVVVAPAMNDGMWADEATQQNVQMLRDRGISVVDPGSGYLACGTEGAGRLAELADIEAAVIEELERVQSLAGKRIVITAGPTAEAIDPVRCITNHSSGKTGYAIAAEAAKRGAQVTLVSGPVSLAAPAGVDVVKVTSALEMLDACRAPYAAADAAVFVAAVSDWRPKEVATSKIKHTGAPAVIELVPNPDIAATLGAEKRAGQVQVVFAAETGNPIEAARGKLASKNADICVANDVSDPGLGFGTDDNKVWFVTADGVEELEQESKRSIASDLLDRIAGLLS